ncbi:MAG: methyltransferase domain-containing protein [Aeromicrobium sp.]
MDTTWDPARYLQFADDRSRPFVDLVARIAGDVGSIVDLGCGPGHLTAVLRSRWPDATIHGVDSSPEMIDRATTGNADDRTTYELADVATWSPPGPVDLIVSNALFQWVPDQLAVIDRLRGHVAPGGSFALQTPNNYSAPSHRLLAEIASQQPYGDLTRGLHEDRGTAPEAYLDLFSRAGWAADVWETTYLHVLQGDDPVFDWISGSGARPVLAALPDALRGPFVAEYRAALRQAYPAQPWGTVLPFARVFTVARRAA